MARDTLSTHEKALQINLDPTKYGAFAEIGAGQEVARWFFRVGGAAGTISKTMSAYDMTVSDAIYGPCERYVSRQRLQTMLAHEYDLQYERLNAKRGDTTRFFVFANTVAATSYKRAEEGSGWMGIRFQTAPYAPPSDIIIHVRLHDEENVQQQEALGIIGVNLVYAAFYLYRQLDALIHVLMDNLAPGRAEVDMIKFSGPDFVKVDNRLMALQLVQQGLTDAAMFTTKGEVVQASEVLYKKPLLVERGSFRPVTRATADMLECARTQFALEVAGAGDDPVVLMEMTLKNLAEGGTIDHRDFLDRVDMAGSLGHMVLISNFGEFYRLAAHLSRHSRQPIGLVLGVPTLREIFDEKYYTHLDGGILESFGRLFKHSVRLYAYPRKDPATGQLITADNLDVAPHLAHLYAYLTQNQFIRPLRNIHEDCLPVTSAEVRARIMAGDASWVGMVPEQVARIIKERQLFGYGGQPVPASLTSVAR